MNSGELKRAKRRVRREVLAERDAVPADAREEAGERVTVRFLALPEVRRARSIMLFSSFGSEIPTRSLIERLHERGVLVALPRIEDGGVVAVRYEPGDPTATTSFGAEEPLGEETLDPSSFDVVAVPGVAFDRTGARIGYGGGFYDRLLPSVPGLTVGLAFHLQVRDEPLPRGRFDVRLAAIVTERETIRSADLNSRSSS